MKDPIISAENLVYEYPDKRALDDVSFQVEEGQVRAIRMHFCGPRLAGAG